MDYRKEKNFVVAYEGDKCKGKFDFSTGNYLGIKGGVVVNTPKAFTMSALENANTNNLLVQTMQFISKHQCNILPDEQKRSRLEALISVGLFPYTVSDLIYTTRLTKELVSFLKEHNDGIYSQFQVDTWRFNKKYGEQLANLSDDDKQTFRNFITYQKNYPPEYVLAMLRQCAHEHTETVISDKGYFIKEYYKIANELYGTVKVNPNLLSNYAQMLFIKKERKKAEQIRNLKEFNDQPWLYYETEKYTIYPLTTPEEFHYEGEHQHNCVEWMYMERVEKKSTHVVVVREKANPTKSLITCEVSNDGRIWQYYKACNKTVTTTDTELYNLKCDYQNHLNSSLSK